jgi:hypothetical protein
VTGRKLSQKRFENNEARFLPFMMLSIFAVMNVNSIIIAIFAGKII